MSNQPTPAEISTNDDETIRRHYPGYRPANTLSRILWAIGIAGFLLLAVVLAKEVQHG